jgi:hypothetical protein
MSTWNYGRSNKIFVIMPPLPLIGRLLVLNSQVEKASKSLITWLSLVVFSCNFFIFVIFAACFTGGIFWID